MRTLNVAETQEVGAAGYDASVGVAGVLLGIAVVAAGPVAWAAVLGSIACSGVAISQGD